MGRGVERVSEAASEGEVVGEVEGEGGGGGEGRKGFGLDQGEDELRVFVRVEMGRREDGSEE